HSRQRIAFAIHNCERRSKFRLDDQEPLILHRLLHHDTLVVDHSAFLFDRLFLVECVSDVVDQSFSTTQSAFNALFCPAFISEGEYIPRDAPRRAFPPFGGFADEERIDIPRMSILSYCRMGRSTNTAPKGRQGIDQRGNRIAFSLWVDGADDLARET